MKTLIDLFLDTLADVYDSEKQITKALPKMSKAAQSEELQEALTAHLAETEEHVKTVEEVFRCFGEKPRGKKCEATAGLLEEGDTLAKDFKGSPAIDSAIISAAQKVEHYEIATYGCLHAWAELLENEEAAELLAGVLEEEKQTDAKLSELAMDQSNAEAMEGEEEEGEVATAKAGGARSPRKRS